MSVCTLQRNKVEAGTTALLKLLNDDTAKQSKKGLLELPSSIFLQVDFIKIPKIQRRIVRIPLKHTLVNDTSEVGLFVADRIRGQRVNHEVTVNYYNQLLMKRGVTDVQKVDVIPSRRVRVEFSTFEARRQLCSMYDIFLIDNKISSYLRPKLGQEFYKHRKWPIPIRIKKKNLKDEILSKLKKTSLVLDGSGVTKAIQVGHVDMSVDEITDNIFSVCEYISNSFPSGWINIRSLHVKGAKSAALPIYLSMTPQNEVPTPKFKNKKRKLRFKDELTTIGRKVTVYPSGRVKVHKESSSESEASDNEIEDTAKVQKKLPAKKRKRKEKPVTAPEENEKEASDNDDADEEGEEGFHDKFESGESEYLYQFMMEQTEREKEEKEKEKKEKQSKTDAVDSNENEKKKRKIKNTSSIKQVKVKKTSTTENVRNVENIKENKKRKIEGAEKGKEKKRKSENKEEKLKKKVRKVGFI